MTGLDVEKEVIIECAVVITDSEMNELERFESVIFQPQTFLEKMDDWNKKHHKESGLLDKISNGNSIYDVENHLIQMIKKHFPSPDDRPILAGNSISQDRMFIDKYLPGFASLLHYRMLDVSSWKIIFNERWNLKYQKKNAHRALDDIYESIAELKYYLHCITINSDNI